MSDNDPLIKAARALDVALWELPESVTDLLGDTVNVAHNDLIRAFDERKKSA